MATLADIASKLEEPFALEDIDFLPKGQFEKDGKTMVMGLPYADPRVYQDRLNVVCPGEWTSQASVTVAGNKIIALVTVTICGVPHTDIGEASLDGPTKENAGTESFAQGFKRACSQVGLGRYLYALDKAYLPYDKLKKKVALDANGLRGEVRKLYAKAGLIAQRVVEQPAPKPQAAKPTPVSETPAEQDSDFRPAGATEQALARISQKCAELYSDKGETVYKQLLAHVFKKFDLGNIQDKDISNEALAEMWNQLRKMEQKQSLAKAS